MATVCANCGMALPREDARFCGICGTLVASHPANAQLEKASQQSIHPALSAAPVSYSSRQYEPREQMAQQSFVRGTQNVRPGEQPGWMNKLENSFEKRGDASASPLQKSPQRPLHVKVWQAEESIDVEKLNTGPLETQGQRALADVSTTQLPAAMSNAARANLQQIVPPAQAKNTLMPQPPPITPVFVDTPPAQTQNMLMPKHPPATPVFAATPPERASVEASIVSSAERKGKKRSSLILALALLALLLVGGGVWIWHYQPFSVAAITQTQQQLSDARVGVSLLYPAGWQVRVDHPSSALSLADSSHTAQLMIQASPQQNVDVTQYLKQQAARRNMTGIKSTQPLSFAGGEWQQIQGSSTQQGANYKETLLATLHGNALFMIVQVAPQSIYTDEERSIFAPIRASLKFL